MRNNRKPSAPREFTPITEDDKILALIHEFNGHKKHDDEVGRQHGLSQFQTSVLRQVFGKTEFVTKWHPQELKDAVVKAYEDGETAVKIAKDNNISISAVYGVLTSMGVERNRRDFWTPIKTKQLVYLRDNQKLSWVEIGQIMGRTFKCCYAKYAHMKRSGKI